MGGRAFGWGEVFLAMLPEDYRAQIFAIPQARPRDFLENETIRRLVETPTSEKVALLQFDGTWDRSRDVDDLTGWVRWLGSQNVRVIILPPFTSRPKRDGFEAFFADSTVLAARRFAKMSGAEYLDLGDLFETCLQKSPEITAPTDWFAAGEGVHIPDSSRPRALTLEGATAFSSLVIAALGGIGVRLTDSTSGIALPGAEIEERLFAHGSPGAVRAPFLPEALVDGHIVRVHEPTLTGFRPHGVSGPRPTLLICPGGGYEMLSMVKEGTRVARWLNLLGIECLVLKYRLRDWHFPAPLVDVTYALRRLRKEAHRRGLDARRIGLLGFSAGGHLAGMAALHWDSPLLRATEDEFEVSFPPRCAALVYPVTSLFLPPEDRALRDNLLGGTRDPKPRNFISLERQARADAPPFFLAHSDDDPTVPPTHSSTLAEALSEKGVSVSLHPFRRGGHGFGLSPEEGDARAWPLALMRWLRRQDFLTS
jgi:acetyl esterase/lipase